MSLRFLMYIGLVVVPKELILETFDQSNLGLFFVLIRFISIPITCSYLCPRLFVLFARLPSFFSLQRLDGAYF